MGPPSARLIAGGAPMRRVSSGARRLPAPAPAPLSCGRLLARPPLFTAQVRPLRSPPCLPPRRTYAAPSGFPLARPRTPVSPPTPPPPAARAARHGERGARRCLSSPRDSSTWDTRRTLSLSHRRPVPAACRAAPRPPALGPGAAARAHWIGVRIPRFWLPSLALSPDKISDVLREIPAGILGIACFGAEQQRKRPRGFPPPPAWCAPTAPAKPPRAGSRLGARPGRRRAAPAGLGRPGGGGLVAK